jgi:hypothetical protein
MKVLKLVAAASVAVLAFAPQPLSAGTAVPSGKALIVPSSSSGGFFETAISVYASTVDNMPADVVLFKGAQVAPGNHIVGLMIQFQGKGNGNWRPYKDTINFRASLLEGHRYIANGRQTGNHIEVWIADADTQRLASKVLSIDLQQCQILSCADPILTTKSKL